jgi:tetratricopeptide (TPR) repeat protein/WD40 repeat protein
VARRGQRTCSAGATLVWDLGTLRKRFAAPPSTGAAPANLTTPPEQRGLFVVTEGVSHRVFDLAGGRLLTSNEGYGPLLMSSDGRVIASGRGLPTSRVEVVRRPAEAGQPVPAPVVIPATNVYGSYLSPDGGTLAAREGGVTGGFVLWDTATGQKRATLPVTGPTTPTFSPDGKRAVLAEHKRLDRESPGPVGWVQVWDVAEGRLLTAWDDRTAARPTAAAAAALVGQAASPHPLARLAAAEAIARTAETPAVAFSPDGRTLLVSFGYGVSVRDPATGREQAVWWFDDGGGRTTTTSLTFSPDGRVVAVRRHLYQPASGQSRYTLSLRHVADGRLLATLPGTNTFQNVLFTPDGRTAIVCPNAIGYDTAVGVLADSAPARQRWEMTLWDLHNGRPRGEARRGPGPVSLSPDGRTVLSQSLLIDKAGHKSGEALWWDADTGRELGRARVTGQVVWHPDGHSLFAPSAEGVRRLSVADGEELARLDGAAAPVAVTADGASLLAAVPEGLGVWDLVGGGRRGTLPQPARLSALGFSPDSPHLAGVADGRAHFWDLDAGAEVVLPAADPRPVSVPLDGRTAWAADLGEPPPPATPGAGSRPTRVLDTGRLRLVAEGRSLQLWPADPTNTTASVAADAAAEVARGSDLLSRGHPDDAVAAFRKATALAPADSRPRLLLADALARQDRRDEAAAALDDACRLDAGAAGLFADLARAWLRDKKPGKAVDLLDRALKYRPDDATLHFARAEALAAQGDPERATAGYEMALALYPDHAAASARLADALSARGRPEEAKAARRRAGEITPALADPDGEKELAELAERLRRDAKPGSDPDLAIGLRLSEDGRLDDALLYLRRAALRNPSSAAALYDLGLVLIQHGDFAEAAGPLRQVPRAAADRAGVTQQSATWLRMAERGPELVALLPKALKGEELPADGVDLMALARYATHVRHRYAATTALFEKALAAHPEWGESSGESPLYYAGVTAVMAADGSGDGRDGSPAERARWRALALAWLRRDLARITREVEAAPPDKKQAVTQSANSWWDDAWLASVRPAPSPGSVVTGASVPASDSWLISDPQRPNLDRLPADERPGWRQLWLDVEGLRWGHLDRRRDGLLRGETDGVTAQELLQYALSRNKLGRVEEGVALLRQAVALSPQFGEAYGNLGWLLGGLQKWDESAAACRAAEAHNVRSWHNTLGWALLNQGRLDEAVEEFRTADRNDTNHSAPREHLRFLEPLLGLEPRLRAVQRGEAEPAGADECLKLARLCLVLKRHAAAARLYEAAFRADPKRSDPPGWDRYRAACHAALAALGEGEDARRLPDKEAVMMRRRALSWLRDELGRWRAKLAGGRAEDRRLLAAHLRHWRTDADLASVRDPQGLAKLSGEEQEVCRKLWDDVAALLRDAEAP